MNEYHSVCTAALSRFDRANPTMHAFGRCQHRHHHQWIGEQTRLFDTLCLVLTVVVSSFYSLCPFDTYSQMHWIKIDALFRLMVILCVVSLQSSHLNGLSTVKGCLIHSAVERKKPTNIKVTKISNEKNPTLTRQWTYIWIEIFVVRWDRSQINLWTVQVQILWNFTPVSR